MEALTTESKVKILLGVLLALNIAFWFHLRPLKSKWANVPPAPHHNFAAAYGLGDISFSYRLNGIMIQNLGDSGGRVTALQDYDFNALTDWFYLQDTLDKKSNYTPYLAAYYFSAVQIPEKMRPMLDYLVQVGSRDEGEKWRYLAQAVYLARFRLEDNDLGLQLAHKLAALPNPNLPYWTRKMPAYVMTARGDKQAAYELMLEIMRTEGEKMHPNELYDMKVYICTRILDVDEAKKNPLCEGQIQ